MRILILIATLALFLHAQKILILNSNNQIKKYQETIDAFQKEFEQPFEVYDISDKSSETIKEYLYSEYPDIVYTVGVKAYQYANKYLSEKDIYFSNIVNWKRLPITSRTFGVSNELHSNMQLTLIKSIFSDIKNIGMIYSDYTKDIFEESQVTAATLGINIIGHKVDKDTVHNKEYQKLFKNIDALMLISDPILLNDEKRVIELFQTSQLAQKPIFAYHELFIKYGAILVISVDNPTSGRQIANMITTSSPLMDYIQYPAGTKIIFNKKQAIKNKIKFNPDSLFMINEVIE
ncbi:MAG: ABC transporter substrate binding protein [Arcobacteraceae bacterium]